MWFLYNHSCAADEPGFSSFLASFTGKSVSPGLRPWEDYKTKPHRNLVLGSGVAQHPILLVKIVSPSKLVLVDL